ncbi:universal stress protein [Maribacter aestuarii]|uniref:universal stress protein n=1 Tax=Maribacter aestuarii TaxID=1130723 RepID=UPI00248AC97B|nr:universal stress protein [Maribacter aestuarii]
MKSIIVPVDFSSQSEYAFQVAASIAKKQNATIYVLHMLELNQAIVSSNVELHPEQMVFFIKLAEKRLSEFMDKPYLKGVNLVPIIKHFKVFSEISEVAQEHSADLIVMGSHGTEGLKEIFVGSNTERVVRNSSVPVLVIKNRIEDFNPRQMVFACDLKEENINAFQKAHSIAAIFSAKLKLVYVNTPGDDFMATSEIQKKMDAFRQAVGSDLSIAIYNDYSIERGVLNYAEESKADVIGMPTHGRKGLSHFFMGSIGEDVANHSEIPVITFKI